MPMLPFFAFILIIWCLPVIGNVNVPSYCIGVDFGTESVRVGIWDTHKVDQFYPVVSKAVPYKTYFPQPGFAEQNPTDWWDCFGQAMKQCIDEGKIDVQHVKGLAIDCTACSVCALDENFVPLCNSLLWMDQRSSQQTKFILDKAKGNEFLKVNSNGNGPISAEWMIPKSLWLKQNEPLIWKKCKVICEKQDFLNFKLTGLLTTSGCNVAARWNWNAISACKRRYYKDDSYEGRPLSLLKLIDLEDIVEKWPDQCVAMGEKIGCLTKDAAEFLGLTSDVEVIQGGPDAYVGMIGSGVITPSKMVLITGSSHLHLAVSSNNSTANGIWSLTYLLTYSLAHSLAYSLRGAFAGAPLLDLNFAEGGQSSTGSALQWARRIFNASFNDLDNEAAIIEPGSDGLLAYEKFQGSRTPITDPLMRASFIGLSLAHSRGHIWRSILEAICYGTKQAIDSLATAGHGCKEIIVAGGACRSKFFLQMHSDVCGLPISINLYDNAPLVGCAILAYAGTMNSHEQNKDSDTFDTYVHAIHDKIQKGIDKFVKVSHIVEPNLNATVKYNQMYNLYKQIPHSIEDITHALVLNKNLDNEGLKNVVLPSKRIGVLSPSLLSANFGRLLDDTSKCVDAGATHIHVDMCDGGSDFCLGSLTFGPQVVAAIKAEHPNLFIDVHLVCQEKTLFNLLDPLQRSGTDRVIVQYESFKQYDSDNFVQLLSITANMIRAKGMKVGICIKPSTSVAELDVLLNIKYKDDPLFEMVNILSVEPGFSKQSFNFIVLDKIKYVYDRWGDNLKDIACDGAITSDTAKHALNAGANYLVSGGFIFDSGKNEIVNQYKKLYQELMVHGK